MRWFQPALYLWAAPATLIGLAPIPVALLQGGRVRIVRGVVEVHGGVITRLLRMQLLGVGSAAAITFGHVVWARDEACLEISRDHERVHVRQYERWGPFFIPLYLAAAAIAWWKGFDPYHDNPFEREAYERDDMSGISQFDKAIADLTEAIRLNRQSAILYYNRGRAWAGKSEYDQAIADFSEAIRLDSQCANAYIHRGLSWDNKGEHDKAIAEYDQVIRLDPQSADAHNNRGLAWIKKYEYDKAIADFTEAIRFDPQDARAYNNRGVAWRRKGIYHEAISNYTHALRLDPESATRYITLAWLLATCPDGQYRDGPKAVQLAGKACELTDYTDAESLCWLAAAHAEAGNFDDAVAWQRKALDLASVDEKAAMRMALKLYETGKPYHET